ncbi:hypothetical protein [Telmatospirillum sp.]|uniref:hypothetical protein n=1 Tax=Telmatospirillum sp. TaxID=2079197 RepID=UPI00284334E1|nr:hypothetical protein [Telmatospirillum sp.]MDR3438090.1 hypothetical protein [Telmatospirillum sp.]
MKQPDVRLQRMIASLADMADDDRAYVLDRLGPEARGRLEPLLTAVGTPDAVSSGLQALMRNVARGQNPKTMTGKAIAALRSHHQAAVEPASKMARSPDGLAGRMSAIIRKGAR